MKKLKMISAPQLAEKLGCSRQYIHKMIKNRTPHKVGVKKITRIGKAVILFIES